MIMAAREMDALEAMKRERGADRQRHRRRMENELRCRVVWMMAKLQKRGRSRLEAAAMLGMSRSTLSAWEGKERVQQLREQPRGRPAVRADDLQRLNVNEAIRVYGPTVGVDTLKHVFPQIPKGELAFLLMRYRIEFRLGNRLIVHTMRWSRPGTLWAMDLAEPPVPIDGIYRFIFSVRDLASGCALLWLPIESKEGKNVALALTYLFHLYGAPLVLKSDNEAVLETPDIQKLLKTWGVTHLLSPRYLPRYNGSCEAGIGTLKTYTYHEAARHDRPMRWTCDDVEAGRLRANVCARPNGRSGPSADRCWMERIQVRQDERADYLARLQAERKERQCEVLTGDDRATAERKAIAAALVACGYLLIRKRVFSALFKTRIWSGIR
jgi:transposase InsO family protein